VGLTEYQRKRDFTKTSEPAGTSPAPGDGEPRFVVQRHRARRLHYDFRLEADGVLVSWAVPKGPTLDPSARHLAVHVEDHPVEYLDFEGVIPKGEYGGGDVIVWDIGTWKLHEDDDARTAVANGRVHAELFGQKLRGMFVLVRTKQQSGKEQWLILHKKDGNEVAGWDPEEHPESVLSGLTNDEVAANPSRVWTREGELTTPDAVPTFAAPTADELAALDALGAKGTWELGGHELALTNLDKVLFPPRDNADGGGDDGGDAVTKRDLVRYYASIAPVMLAYLHDRPINLNRYPDGVEKAGFWQKQAPDHAPDWIPRWRNTERTPERARSAEAGATRREEADDGESVDYFVIDTPPALAWLANHAAVELHAWTSRIPAVHRPTYALIDLDPGETTTWEDLLVLARLHRTALEHLDVRGYPKVTGRRGIQVWVPIRPGPPFDEVRGWVEQLSRAVGGTVPDLVSWTWTKRDRRGLARLDYTQNAINKTLVAPYSPRPSPGAPVSVPIEWDELDDPDLRPDRWTIATVLDRVAERGDPMGPALTDPQVLPSLG
jgi:bifunctional non-homologous end joining protein LigD